MRNLAIQNPELERFFYLDRAVSRPQAFGSLYSCIDDLGGPIVLRETGRLPAIGTNHSENTSLGTRGFCQNLIRLHREANRGLGQAAIPQDCAPNNPNQVVQTAALAIAPITERAQERARPPRPQRLALTAKNIARGRSLLQSRCQSCHAAGHPRSLSGRHLFLENEQALRSTLGRTNAASFLERMTAQDPVDRMPLDQSALPQSEVQAIEAYLRSLESGRRGD